MLKFVILKKLENDGLIDPSGNPTADTIAYPTPDPADDPTADPAPDPFPHDKNIIFLLNQMVHILFIEKIRK